MDPRYRTEHADLDWARRFIRRGTTQAVQATTHPITHNSNRRQRSGMPQPDAALEGFTRQMRRLPVFLRQSLTYDRGSEMAHHAELAVRLNIDIWFADPYAPRQRGSSENTHGLLRQFLPKGADLSTASQTMLNDIARFLSGRPRRTLDRRTPEEAMAEEIAKFSNRVALDS